MPKDIFGPLDVALKAAPHNVLATMLSGGQVVAIQPTSTSGSSGPGAVTTTPYGGTSGISVAAGPSPARAGLGIRETGTASGRPEVKFPQTVNIKVVEKSSKVPIPDAAVSVDGIPFAVTDAKGIVSTSDLSSGKHTISVDSLEFESGEKEIYVAEPSGFPATVNYTVELAVLPTELSSAEEAGAGGLEEAVEEAGEAAGEAAGGYYGGGYGYQQPPSYQPPSYEAPSYGAPSYGAPSYGGPGYQPQQPAQGLPALPLPPLEWLQQFLLLPFTTIQSAMSIGPMSRGGRCR